MNKEQLSDMYSELVRSRNFQHAIIKHNLLTQVCRVVRSIHGGEARFQLLSGRIISVRAVPFTPEKQKDLVFHKLEILHSSRGDTDIMDLPLMDIIGFFDDVIKEVDNKIQDCQ